MSWDNFASISISFGFHYQLFSYPMQLKHGKPRVNLQGFPGRPKIGVPDQCPKIGGDPGRIFTRQNLMSPFFFHYFRTKSLSPMETPPEVIITSQFSAASFQLFF